MQGWRVTMEDAHAAVLDLKIPKEINCDQLDQPENEGPETETDKRIAYFGVYDGHGGMNCFLFYFIFILHFNSNLVSFLISRRQGRDLHWQKTSSHYCIPRFFC